jgi:poly(3-hydroxybutyrate) depolymerase
MRTTRWPWVLRVCLLVASVGLLYGAKSAEPATAAEWVGTAVGAAGLSFKEVMSNPNRTVGFIPKTLATGGRAPRKYQVWIPLGYTRARKWPVILFLHGPDGCGADGEKMLAQGLPQAIKKRNGRFDFIVVIPQCPSPRGWLGAQERFAVTALTTVLEEYSCDRRRLYLTGVSTGGNATYALAAKYPTEFAAIAPVGGIGDVRRAKTIARVPAWIWHGETDKTVAVDKARNMVKALRGAGAAIKYTELPNVGEGAWDQAYAGDALWTWFLGHTCPEKKVATAPVDDGSTGGFRKMDGKFGTKMEKGHFDKMGGKMTPMR